MKKSTEPDEVSHPSNLPLRRVAAATEAIHTREGETRRKVFEEGLKVAPYAMATAMPLLGVSGAPLTIEVSTSDKSQTHDASPAQAVTRHPNLALESGTQREPP